MRVKSNDRIKVWDITDEGNGVAEVKISVSRKINTEKSYDKILEEKEIAKNGYVATYFSFIRVKGAAYNKIGEIEVGDTITNVSMTIEQEPYFNNETNAVAYPKNPKFTIWDFELYTGENVNYTGNMDKAPQVAEEPQEVEEAKTVVEKPAPAPVEVAKASEECPF